MLIVISCIKCLAIIISSVHVLMLVQFYVWTGHMEKVQKKLHEEEELDKFLVCIHCCGQGWLGKLFEPFSLENLIKQEKRLSVITLFSTYGLVLSKLKIS